MVHKGGYVLARPADKIAIKDVLAELGGVLFDKSFCGQHTGSLKLCTNSVDCSARSLWQMIQFVVDHLLDKVTLHELINTEKESTRTLTAILEQSYAI